MSNRIYIYKGGILIMKTLIVYGTKYGCTEGCAKDLAKKLSGDTELCNIKNSRPSDLEKYEKVIIGGSIYMGKIQKEITDFCEANKGLLMEKTIGLFICSMREGEMAQEELISSFPKELWDRAITKENFGGEFIFKKMSFLDKLIVKKVSKIDKDTSNILNNNIIKFAEIMNKA